MSYGISPDFLIVRADTDIPGDMMDKIASMSGIARTHVISAPTLDSIYRVPMAFHHDHLGEKIMTALALGESKIDMKKWEELLENIDKSEEVLKIGMVGKYIELEDAYYSLNEWLKCAGFGYKKRVRLRFIEAENIEKMEFLNLNDWMEYVFHEDLAIEVSKEWY